MGRFHFLKEPTGASYVTSTPVTSLEQKIRSISGVGNAIGFAALLQQTLVIDPLRRPCVSDLLGHLFFVGPSNPTTPPGATSE